MSKIVATITNVEAATDDDGNRRTTSRGNQFSFVTIRKAEDGTEVRFPVWEPLEEAEENFPVGESGLFHIEEQVQRNFRSVLLKSEVEALNL